MWSMLWKHSPKKVTTVHDEPQSASVYDFYHSEEYSTIDSNSSKIIEVNGYRHQGIVWLVPTVWN